MKNYAWINLADGVVENVICYDGVTPIELPQGIILVEYPNEGIVGSWSAMGPGWSYIDGQFVEPPQPQPEPVIPVSVNNQPTTTGSQTL
jgi:hypothetical protein